jgi:hypothetical protein
MHAMFLRKLRWIAFWVLAVSVIASGLGLLWSASQAAAPAPAAQNAPPPREGEANGTTIRPWVVWSGPNSQIGDASYRRITSGAEWQNLWLTHTGKTLAEAAADIPQIDFQQGMVVTVLQGARFNCRGVTAVSVTETTDTITFRFAGQYYQTSEKADAVKPFGFFLLPRSGKSLVLEENVQSMIGQPPVWKVRAQFDAVVLAPPAKPDAPAVRPADPNAPVVFDRDIKPILQARCGACHGVAKFKGGFDCRTHAGVLKGGESGAGVVPGDPHKSEVWTMVNTEEMPPKGEPQLTGAEKGLILRWIKGGAHASTNAGDPEVIRGRLKQIAAHPGNNSAFREKVLEGCAALLAKETDLQRRFVSPALDNQQQANQFRTQLMNVQMNVGLVMFKLDTLLDELEGMRPDRANEPKKWQANYDYVLARLSAQVASLYEYNSKLGQLRRDFPEIDPKLHQGWQLVDGETFTDRDADKYAKRAQRFLQDLARDQAGTAWEDIAMSEPTGMTGLVWKPWPRDK